MTPRMKWLLLACGGIFGLYGADSTYRSWVEQPHQELTARLDALQTDLNESKQQQMVAQKVGRRLEEYSQRALPADPQLARSLYQEWLLDLVDRHQWTAASIDAAQPVPIEIRSRTKKGKRVRVGYRIDYSLRSQASLAKFAALLDDFRTSGHLHKIKSLAINPIGSEGRLDANLTIQVLCLEAASHESTLGDWSMLPDAREGLKPATGFVRRNLFARGFAKALQEMAFKAITVNRAGITEAWFTTDNRGTIAKVPAGKNIPVALHDVSVVEILNDRALVQLNDDSYWVRLGQTIGQAVDPAGISTDPAGTTPLEEKP